MKNLKSRQAHINAIKKRLEEIKEKESTKEIDTLIEMKYLIRERVFKRSI